MVLLAILVLVVVLLLWISPARIARRARAPRDDKGGPFLPYGVPVVPGAPLENSVFDNVGDGLRPTGHEISPGGGDFGGGGASGGWDGGGDSDGGGDGGD
jgi:hypothetical protein